tara:strand:- start:33426 stop:33728 length:303 start_codon:yes stop_codon:yes gene_type:complete
MTAPKAGDLLPITEHLRDAPTHQARAEWLCTAPEGVILRENLKIRDLLIRDGFEEGCDYLAVLVSKINARRLKDGRYPATVLMAVEMALATMLAAARKGE